MHISQIKARPPVDQKFWLRGLTILAIGIWAGIVWLFWTIPF